MARTCPSCGSEARDTDRFCGRCGTGLAGVGASGRAPHAFCTSCGAPLSETDRFCGRCGAATASPPRDEADDEQFDERDFFSDWEGERTPPDQARTELVRLRGARASDTAVLPPVESRGGREDRPAPSPPDRPQAPGRGFPWGATFAFVGAVAVVASSAVPWLSGGRVLPRDLAFQTLVFGPPASGGPSLGLVLLGVGMAGALLALLTMAVPSVRLLRRLLGVITLGVPAAFLVRVGFADLTALFANLGPGVYIALAGALTEMVAGRRT